MSSLGMAGAAVDIIIIPSSMVMLYFFYISSTLIILLLIICNVSDVNWMNAWLGFFGGKKCYTRGTVWLDQVFSTW